MPPEKSVLAEGIVPEQRRFGLMTIIVFMVIVLDQFTKWQVAGGMRLHDSISIVPDFFNLTYIRNSGAAFGILSGSHAGFRMVFFGVTSILALFLREQSTRVSYPGTEIGQASVGVVFGGALGNLIDRVRIGEVIDFLDVSIAGYHWPAFNVADSAITIGVGLLIVHFFLHEELAINQQG